MYFADNNFLRFLVAIGLLWGVAACGAKKDSGKKPGQAGAGMMRAEAFIVTPRVHHSIYTASGSLVPNEQIGILPEISGRVTALSFTEGSFVKKGQTLVQLYDADIRAMIQKLRAQKELQEKTLERQDKLLGIGGISRQDFETTETQIASIDADIAYQEAMLRKTRIIAPFDRVIGIRGISSGAIVSPSTLVATLQQTHPLKMDFSIPDQYRNRITRGETVLFTVDGRMDTLKGQISAIEPGADAATRTIRVRAQVPNPDGSLTAGSFAHVILSFNSDTSSIIIPSQSVIPTTRDKKVARLKNGLADIVVIRTGERTEGGIVVEHGLQPGDTVLTTGIMQVKQGMNVSIEKIVENM